MKKKVLYIHHGKGIGGAPLSLLYLVQALNKDHYHPVVLFQHDSDALKLFTAHGIEVLGPVNRYDFPHTRIWWLRWYHALFFFRVLKDTFITRYQTAFTWLEKIKPDIVHLNTSSLIAWGIAAHKKKIPVVWHIRELLADGYLGIRKKIIANTIARHSAAIVPICKHDGKPWETNEKKTVVYNAVNPALFDHTISPEAFIRHHQLDDQAPKILFLGGLSQEKGTELILKSFGLLKQKVPHAQLLIAGYFSLAQKNSPIKKYFPAQRYANHVHTLYREHHTSIKLLGPITNVHEALAACDVLVFPATVGHFARPVIEAGFMKKPVIASSCAPLNELVINGQTGLLVDPTDPVAWADALANVLTNKEFGQTLGSQGFDFCSKHFSIKQQIKKIESIYEKVAKTHEQPRT